MAIAATEVHPSRGAKTKYRFPPGLERNLVWLALRKLRPANPIVLFQQLTQQYGDVVHYKI